MTAQFSFSTFIIDELHDLERRCAEKEGIEKAIAWRSTITGVCYDADTNRVTCINGDDFDHWLIPYLNHKLAKPQGQSTGFIPSPRSGVPHDVQDANFLAAFVAYMEKHPEPISTSKVVNEIKRHQRPYGHLPPHARCRELLATFIHPVIVGTKDGRGYTLWRHALLMRAS